MTLVWAASTRPPPPSRAPPSSPPTALPPPSPSSPPPPPPPPSRPMPLRCRRRSRHARCHDCRLAVRLAASAAQADASAASPPPSRFAAVAADHVAPYCRRYLRRGFFLPARYLRVSLTRMRNRRAGPKAKSSPAVTASASSITNRPREALHSRGDFQCASTTGTTTIRSVSRKSRYESATVTTVAMSTICLLTLGRNPH